MTGEGRASHFWQTLPGILTGVAALLTALTGLLVVLFQAGVFAGDGTAAPSVAASTTPMGSSMTSVAASPTVAAAAPNADAIAGSWTGEARDGGGQAFEIALTVTAPCALGQECGTIRISRPRCEGAVFLQAVHADRYEFHVDRFTPESDEVCTPGAGEHFTPMADGTLRYEASYAPGTTGTLSRTGD